MWLIDSGSEQDLISKAALRNVSKAIRKQAPQPIRLVTANGNITASEIADINVDALCEPAQPYVLESSPAVLSLGVKCLDQGYSFHWESGKAPVMVRPDGALIQLKVDGHVPYMDSSCEAEPSLSAVAASRPAPAPVHDEGIDEGDDPDDEVERFVRSRKEEDLVAEASTKEHLFAHYPKNPFCRTCQRAKMLAPYARSKGGQGRLETKAFGDHIIADHVILKTNIEQGIKGEWCALVIKDVHTQFRYVYPSTSKSTEQSVAGIQHFISGRDEVEVLYTDNSRELKAAIEQLGYRHQTSIEYVDSSKSFVEREIRHLLEGARANLVQSGFPLSMWPFAIQHNAVATNILPQLNGNDSPWYLRFNKTFDEAEIPFGAKILFWNNPARADNQAGKTSPTSNEGVFLGYHIQPGFAWKGEFLVAKLEGLDYHIEHASLTVQRTKRIELPTDEFIFPMRLLKDPASHPPVASARTRDDPVPLERGQAHIEEPAASEKSEAKAKPVVPDKGGAFDPSIMPDGSPAPDGYVWDGVRLVRRKAGSKRPPDIPSDMWVMLGSQDRKALTQQYEDQLRADAKKAVLETAVSSEARSEHPEAASSAKPTSAAREGEPTLPVIRHAPAMSVLPERDKSSKEPHRPQLRELVKERIKKVEFDVALELFSAVVARLVPKAEVANTPKAQAALDKEWENLRKKGTWDEFRVNECRRVIREAQNKGEKVHIGRIFEACYEKGSELPDDDPNKKFKGRTVFQGNNVYDENSVAALFAELGSSPASMEAAKILDAFGSQPGYRKAQADAKQAYIQALFKGVPTWLRLPKNRWPSHWSKQYIDPIVPLVLALYGHPDSGGLWEKHLEDALSKQGFVRVLPEIWTSIFHHPELDLLLVVYVDDFKLAGPAGSLDKGWDLIGKVVEIDAPEPFGRYFGCHHIEKNNVRLSKEEHPFNHVFEGSAQHAGVCSQRRTEDYWEHDENTKTWTRYHLQPRKCLFRPKEQMSAFACSLDPQRVTIKDQSKSSPICDEWSRHASDRISADTAWWTGRTVFSYGENQEAALNCALPSKPGSMRDKTAAKKEVKVSKFKGPETICDKPVGCMTKEVNIVEYDMSDFLKSCVDAYCELAKVNVSSLSKVSTPFIGSKVARPVVNEEEPKGRLQTIAAKVLMKILFAARMARYDLLRATQSLASRVSKWSTECDGALHRLVSYIHCSRDLKMRGFIGDKFSDCRLWLFADADWAGEYDSHSTTGCIMILVGPNTYYPLNTFSRKQTATATSSTEAEVIAANQALRAEGLPTLSLFCQLSRFGKEAHGYAQKAGKASFDVPDGIVARIDPELDEIRYGNVDAGTSVANINALTVHLSDKWKVKLMEDNQATITILQQGHSQKLRHTDRTQRISFRWLQEQFVNRQFELINVDTTLQAADILTKAFDSTPVWHHALELIGISPNRQARACATSLLLSPHIKAGEVSDQGGQIAALCNVQPKRLLVEFCCSTTSRLGESRDSSKGCRVIRVTEAEDGCSDTCRQWLVHEIAKFRSKNPKGAILFYVSLPCTGGCPWGYVSQQTPKGAAKIEGHIKQFRSLLRGFKRILNDVCSDDVRVAFELPKACRYWKWPELWSFLTKYKMNKYEFHGCKIGIKGRSGKSMKKQWVVASNMPTISVVEYFKCDGSHEHDQSRGTHLKEAEGYTFVYTDAVHNAFSEHATMQPLLSSDCAASFSQ